MSCILGTDDFWPFITIPKPRVDLDKKKKSVFGFRFVVRNTSLTKTTVRNVVFSFPPHSMFSNTHEVFIFCLGRRLDSTRNTSQNSKPTGEIRIHNLDNTKHAH